MGVSRSRAREQAEGPHPHPPLAPAQPMPHPRWPRRPASLEGEEWSREEETLLGFRPGQVRRFFLRVERVTLWVQQRSRRVPGDWQRWWERSVGGERWSRGRAQDRGQNSGWSRGERGLGRVDRRRRCGSGARWASISGICMRVGDGGVEVEGAGGTGEEGGGRREEGAAAPRGRWMFHHSDAFGRQTLLIPHRSSLVPRPGTNPPPPRRRRPFRRIRSLLCPATGVLIRSPNRTRPPVAAPHCGRCSGLPSPFPATTPESRPPVAAGFGSHLRTRAPIPPEPEPRA